MALATILYIGLKCEEAGNPPSELQKQLRQQAEQMGERHQGPIHVFLR